MKIKIEHFKNLKKMDYTIEDNKINFLFGMSGSGKSSILNALAGDNPESSKTFGALNTENVSIKVDGSVFSPTDIHVFNTDKMGFILDSSDVEFFKEVIIARPDEHRTIHKTLEDKLTKLNSAINSEINKYEQYGTMLDELKTRKLTKSNTLPITSPFAKTMTKLKQAKDKRAFKYVTAMNGKQLEWVLNGINFITGNNCPFCDKKMGKKTINKLNKMSNFDSKSIGNIKDTIASYSTVLGMVASYEYSEMKKREKEIIKYVKAVTKFDEILEQTRIIFEQDYNYNNFRPIVLNQDFSKLFPNTSKAYKSICKNVPKLVDAIKKTQQETDDFLKHKKAVINDMLEELSIPYSFEVKYHRSGPNEYSIIHKSDFTNNDDKQCMSEGEKAIVSLLLFLVAAKSTNYKIYVIDDPVSSFDNYRRNLIYRYILKYLKNKTVLIMSHDSIFAKYAINDRARKIIGTVSYLSNDGKNDAIIQSIKTVQSVSFFKSVINRCQTASNQYQKCLLARYLFEEEYNKCNPKYTYLSKVIHGVPYVDIQNWITGKGKTEQEIIDGINSDLANHGIKNANYLTPLDPNYNINVDISNYSVFEKCIVCRELVNKGAITVNKNVKTELSCSVHLNDVLAICLDVFSFPVISRTLLDAINVMPNIIPVI